MMDDPGTPLRSTLLDRLADYPDPQARDRRLAMLDQLPATIAEPILAKPESVNRLAALVIAGDAPVNLAVRHTEHLSSALGSDHLPDIPSLPLAAYKTVAWLWTVAREQTGELGVEQSAAAYAELADRLSRQTLASVNANPPQLLLFALGKWGGRELNAASDIDPVFFADPELNPETSDRLVRGWNKQMSGSRTNPVYTVDLRLRPEGDAGPLAWPLALAERYFLQRASSWERIAWLRARPVSGEEPSWFRQLLNHFLFSMGGDVRTKMEAIVRSLRNIHDNARPRDLKRAPGGIRDIEFLVASYQIAEGAQEPSLRQGSMPGLLRQLAQSDLISGDQAEQLLDSYRFLRRLEHILQVEECKPRFIVPDPGDLAHNRVAYAFGILPQVFETTWQQHCRSTQQILEEALPDTAEAVYAGTATIDPQAEPDAIPGAQRLDSRAQSILNRLSGRWGPATRLFDAEVLFTSPSATDALARLEAAVQAYGGPETWTMAFGERPAVKRDISRILLHGRRIVEEANQRPFLWERLGANSYPMPEMGTLEMLNKQMGDLTFQLGEAFLAGAVGPEELTETWTHGVDKLATMLARGVLDATDRHPGIALLAGGKWGGRELAPDGDLDLLFICDEAESDKLSDAVYTVTGFLSTLSLNGRLTPDARLRPEGSGAPLCVTLSRLENYLSSRAATWEKLALARSRYITGDRWVGTNAQHLLKEFAAMPPTPDEMPRIHQARKKASELARAKQGVLRIKKARGGMMDFEFAAMFAFWRTGLTTNGSGDSLFTRLRLLESRDHNHETDWRRAFDCYTELRRWELVQTFASAHRRGDVPVSGQEGERFAEAAGLSVDEIRSRWDEISAFGRKLYDTMANEVGALQ